MGISPKQQQFLIDKLPRMTICEGAISSGKTFICNHKAIQHISFNYTNKGLIFFMGRTLTTLQRNVLDPLSLAYGSRFTYSLNQKKATLCGVKIQLEGCNDVTSESKIRGSTAEFIYGDELTLWNNAFLTRCMGSLRTPNACFLGTTNPDTPSNFVKVNFLDREEELGLRRIKFMMDDNPSLTKDYVEQIQKEYVGVFHDRFIKGLWVIASGLVYSNFDKETHVVNSIDRDYSEYIVSMDYGTYNPFCALLWGLCDGVWYCVKEYWHNGRLKNIQKTDEEYRSEIIKWLDGVKITKLICDPSASSFIACIRRDSKFTVLKAKNSKIDGIRDVLTCLSHGKIKINNCCNNVIREFGLYSWKDKNVSEDEPVDDENHAMDALRYFVYTTNVVVGKRKSFLT
jgi:PBSX family phage terminase large subunit